MMFTPWPHLKEHHPMQKCFFRELSFPKISITQCLPLATTSTTTTANGGVIVKIYKCNIPINHPTHISDVYIEETILFDVPSPGSSSICETQLCVQE